MSVAEQTGFPGLPGESWEDYAHRLERRIKEQRDHITRIQTRGDEHRNKWTRARVAQLERALGRACEAADRRKEQRDNVIAQSRTREQRFFGIESALSLWVYATECECEALDPAWDGEQRVCRRCLAVQALGYDPRGKQ